MKILFLGLLMSFNLFATESNVRPTICYTSADCIDTAGSTVETVIIKKCSGSEYAQPFKKYQICKMLTGKPYGVCEKEVTGFEMNPEACWNDEDLP